MPKKKSAKKSAKQSLGEFYKLIKDSGIDPDHVVVERMSLWEQKLDQEPNKAVRFYPPNTTAPPFPILERSAPVRIRPNAPSRRSDGLLRAMFYPDPQMGFWRDLETGELHPMHDPLALDVALQIGEIAKPDYSVNNGDGLDLAALSRFETFPTLAQTTNPAIQEYKNFLAIQDARSGGSEQIVISGNHDERLQKTLRSFAMELVNLKRADSTPEDWPVLSVPYLCRLDELGIEYIPGFPAGQKDLREDFIAIHGKFVGDTAAQKHLKESPNISVCFGHTHRMQHFTATQDLGGGKTRTTHAFSAGTLARIDGWVPSYYSGVSERDNLPVGNTESWTQGVTVATFDPEPGGPITLEQVPISKGVAIFRGERIEAGRFTDLETGRFQTAA